MRKLALSTTLLVAVAIVPTLAWAAGEAEVPPDAATQRTALVEHGLGHPLDVREAAERLRSARERLAAAERRAERRREARAARRAAAEAGGSQAADGAQGGGAVAVPAHLEAIAQCESGGDPTAIGGGGLYRGKYQFSVETWQAVGGTGDPAAAPEAEQDRRAIILYETAGPGQWPVCGS